MESFFGTIKTESLHHYRFKTREHAKRIIFEYIEVFFAFGDMQKLVIKYLLTSLVSITLAVKLQQHSDDLPVH